MVDNELVMEYKNGEMNLECIGIFCGMIYIYIYIANKMIIGFPKKRGIPPILITVDMEHYDQA